VAQRSSARTGDDRTSSLMTTRQLVFDAMAGLGDLSDFAVGNYEPKGIFTSEMAAVIAVALAMKIEVFVESGRARGHSTLLLAKHLASCGIAVHSFDRDRNADAIYAERQLAGLPGLHLHYGDARLLIPPFITDLGNKRVALLIDGPKGKKAFDLLSCCIAHSPAICVAFVHDLALLVGGTPLEGRRLAQTYFSDPFLTDDAEFVERFGHLDAPIFAATERGEGHWRPFHNGRADQASYGPTMGIFVPSPADRAAAVERGCPQGVVTRLYWMICDRLRRGPAGTKMAKRVDA
jgi:hypothetical protein